MPESQNEFKGWARVEIMGHQSHIGYVTTETYGQAVLFRVDQPCLDRMEETLTEAAWVGDKYCQPGSIVERGAIPSASVLLGSQSIYRLIPCDEATAIRAIRSSQHRPLSIVKLGEQAALAASNGDDPGDDDDDPYEDRPV